MKHILLYFALCLSAIAASTNSQAPLIYVSTDTNGVVKTPKKLNGVFHGDGSNLTNRYEEADISGFVADPAFRTTVLYNFGWWTSSNTVAISNGTWIGQDHTFTYPLPTYSSTWTVVGSNIDTSNTFLLSITNKTAAFVWNGEKWGIISHTGAASASSTNTISGVTTNISVPGGTMFVTNGLIKRLSQNAFLFPDLVANPDRAKIGIPMYITPPTADWTNLFALGSNYVSIISVTVDAPTNGFGGHGPGTATQANWLWAITNAQAAGIKVVGYVEPQYGSIPLETVLDRIDKWYEFYPTIDGIFMDEVDFSGQNAWYMQQVSNRIRSHEKNLIVFNPGWFIDTEMVMNLCDIVMCSETYYSTFLTLTYPPPWIYNYPPWRFWEITHSCTNTWGAPSAEGCEETWNLSKARNAGHVFVTEQLMDFPWTGLGSLIDTQTNLVAQTISTNLLASALKDVQVEVSPYYTYPSIGTISTAYNKGTYPGLTELTSSGGVSVVYEGIGSPPYFNFPGTGYLRNLDYERYHKLTTWCIFKTSSTNFQTLIGGNWLNVEGVWGNFRLYTVTNSIAVAYPLERVSTNNFTTSDYHLAVAIHSEYSYLSRLYLDGVLQNPWTGSWWHLIQLGIGANADGGSPFTGRMRSAGVIGHAISDDEHRKIIDYARNVWGLNI